MPITSVTIAASRTVTIAISRPLVGAALLWCADKTIHQGNGFMRDSDPFIAPDTYVFTSGTGQDPAEGSVSLIGSPYPSHGWVVAFSQPITAV